MNLAAVFVGFIRGGKLKALGIAAPRRHPLLPDVPTLDEQGIHGVESNNWYALFAPAKTPRARIEQINAAVRRVLSNDPYRARLIDSGADPMPGRIVCAITWRQQPHRLQVRTA